MMDNHEKWTITKSGDPQSRKAMIDREFEEVDKEFPD